MACAFPRFGAVWRRECRPSHFLWSPTRRSFCGGPLPRTRASASTRSLGNDQTSSSKTGQRPGPAGGRGQSSGSDGAGRRPGSYERGEKGVERKEDPEPDGGCGGAQNKADWGGLRPGRAQATDGVGGSPCDVPLCSCVFGVMASRTGRICFGRVCFGF